MKKRLIWTAGIICSIVFGGAEDIEILCDEIYQIIEGKITPK